MTGGYWVGVWQTEKSFVVKQGVEKVGGGASRRVDVSKLPVSRDLWDELAQDAPVKMGDPLAKVTMIAFLDLDCEACISYLKESYPYIKEKYIESGLVQYWVFPFSQTDYAGKRVVADHAKASGITVNPSFFVAQHQVIGAQPRVTFETIIEKALAEAK